MAALAVVAQGKTAQAMAVLELVVKVITAGSQAMTKRVVAVVLALLAGMVLMAAMPVMAVAVQPHLMGQHTRAVAVAALEIVDKAQVEAEVVAVVLQTKEIMEQPIQAAAVVEVVVVMPVLPVVAES